MTRSSEAPAHETAAYLASLDCVHCGLCIEHCPTYLVTGRETANPRGRVYLMRALAEGRAEPSPAVVSDLDLCLVCRACESVCPSGVRFGEVMAETRSGLRRPGFLRRWMLRRLETRRRLHAFAGLVRFAQVLGLPALARLGPKKLRTLAGYSPRIPPRKDRAPLPARVAAVGASKGRVGLLEGCVMSVLFADVNRDTARLLAAAGYDVEIPERAGCCGALHEHDGDLKTAHDLLGKAASAFSDPSLLAVVTNSAGCGAMLAGAGRALQDEAGASLAKRAVDLSRFLLDYGERLSFRTSDLVVTYDAPCHLHHAQRETEAPLQLLARIPGLRIVPMKDAALCCGAAGIYNLDQPEMSRAILERKLDHLEATGAGLLVTGNPGCILQWRAGIHARGLGIRVLHPATLLAQHLAQPDAPSFA